MPPDDLITKLAHDNHMWEATFRGLMYLLLIVLLCTMYFYVGATTARQEINQRIDERKQEILDQQGKTKSTSDPSKPLSI